MEDNKKPLISVVMPTYNSEETIRKALDSLKEQSIPEDQIEIFVVDGGSTDGTLQIAKEFNVKILQNPERVPEKAKFIGIQNANGKYVVKMDSDEVFVSPLQLQNRLDLFNMDERLQCITINYLDTPKFEMHNFSRAYLNIYGDPFSAFIYKNKGTLLKTFKKNIAKSFEGEKFSLNFNDGDILPIADGGTTMFSLDYAKENFPTYCEDTSFAVIVCDEIISKTRACGCIKEDKVLHYSKASIKGYLKKLKFRVLNNLYKTEDSGFANRSSNSANLGNRKYLFMLYVVSIIFPLFDSFKLAIRHKDATMLAHFFYVYAVTFFLVFYGIRKVLGFKDKNEEY